MSTLNFVKKLTVETTLKDLIVITLSSLIIALAAQISLTFSFISPVPFTLQPHAVLLLSALLGARNGFLCVLLYLLEGTFGLPFFTHGRSGIMHLFGPTGGYLMSYLIVSYLTGLAFERKLASSWYTRVTTFVMGNGIIYLCGASWLALFVGIQKSWIMGVQPFLGTDLLKILTIAFLYSPISKLFLFQKR